MYLIKRTGQTFANRKEIKEYLGASKFRRYFRNGEALYLSSEMIDKLQKFSVLKNNTLSIQ